MREYDCGHDKAEYGKHICAHRAEQEPESVYHNAADKSAACVVIRRYAEVFSHVRHFDVADCQQLHECAEEQKTQKQTDHLSSDQLIGPVCDKESMCEEQKKRKYIRHESKRTEQGVADEASCSSAYP